MNQRPSVRRLLRAQIETAQNHKTVREPGEMRLRLLFFFLLLSTATWACGKERWDVKTMADAEAAELLVHQIVEYRTLDALTAVPAPANLRLPGRLADEEKRMFDIFVRLVGHKVEADEDFHVVIGSLRTKATMILEFPSVHCMPLWAKQLAAARATISRLDKGGKRAGLLRPSKAIFLEVRGFGFFDKCHGQTGRAPNCIEIHPGLSAHVIAEDKIPEWAKQ